MFCNVRSFLYKVSFYFNTPSSLFSWLPSFFTLFLLNSGVTLVPLTLVPRSRTLLNLYPHVFFTRKGDYLSLLAKPEGIVGDVRTVKYTYVLGLYTVNHSYPWKRTTTTTDCHYGISVYVRSVPECSFSPNESYVTSRHWNDSRCVLWTSDCQILSTVFHDEELSLYRNWSTPSADCIPSYE